jgi:3-hydroxy-9,10-secoandrosta-1,3,5(10)-triene-9,17-dione monooxygenase reductase component
MIHTEHPFVPDPEDRDPARRFRGRLATPVTIVTAGSGERRAGLTVSSLFVVDGEPPLVHLLVGPTTDLWDIAGDTGRFVVHICDYERRHLADAFAGLSPSPGGVFATTNTVMSEFGPVIEDLGDRAFCELLSRDETGYLGLIVGRIHRMELTDLLDPLIHLRGRYRHLG